MYIMYSIWIYDKHETNICQEKFSFIVRVVVLSKLEIGRCTYNLIDDHISCIRTKYLYD